MNRDVFSEHVKNAFDTSSRLPWGINPIDYDNFLPISAPAIAMCMSGINNAEEVRGVDKTTFYGYFKLDESNKVELTGSVSDFENTIKLSSIKSFHLYVRDLQNAIEGLVLDENYPDTMEDYMRRCFDYRWRLSGVPAAMRIDNNVPITTVSGVVNIDFYDRVSSGLWPMTWQEISGITSFVGVDLAGTNRTSNLDEFITAPSGRDVGGQIIKGVQSSEFSTENLPSRAEGHHQYGPMVCPIWVLQSLIWGPAQVENFYIDQVQPSGANEKNFSSVTSNADRANTNTNDFARGHLIVKNHKHYPTLWNWLESSENNIDPRQFEAGNWGYWTIPHGKWSSTSGVVTISDSGAYSDVPKTSYFLGQYILSDGGSDYLGGNSWGSFHWNLRDHSPNSPVNEETFQNIPIGLATQFEKTTYRAPTSLDYPIFFNTWTSYPEEIADYRNWAEFPYYLPEPGEKPGKWSSWAGKLCSYTFNRFSVAWSNIPIGLKKTWKGVPYQHKAYRSFLAQEENDDIVQYIEYESDYPVNSVVHNYADNNNNNSEYTKIRFGPGSKLITDVSGIRSPSGLSNWNLSILTAISDIYNYYEPEVYNIRFLSSSHINYDQTRFFSPTTYFAADIYAKSDNNTAYKEMTSRPYTDDHFDMGIYNDYKNNSVNTIYGPCEDGYRVGNFSANGPRASNENWPSGAGIEDMWFADKYYPNRFESNGSNEIREGFISHEDHLGATLEQLVITTSFENTRFYFNNGEWGQDIEEDTISIRTSIRTPPYDPDLPDDAYTFYYMKYDPPGSLITRNKIEIRIPSASRSWTPNWNESWYNGIDNTHVRASNVVDDQKMQISKVIVTFPTILKTSDPEVAYSGVG